MGCKQGYRKEPQQLGEMHLPMIVFWNFNHFLVLEGFDSKWVYLNDPESGPRSHLCRVRRRLYRRGTHHGAWRGIRTRRRKTKLLHSLRKRLIGSEAGVGFLILSTLFLVLPGLLAPAFSKIFIDQILIDGMTDWLRPLLLAMIITLIIQSSLSYLQQNSLRRLEVKLAIKSSSEFFKHVLSLPVNFFQQRFAGEIANRVGLNDRIAELLSGDLATNTVGFILVFFYSLVMLMYDWVLALVGIAIALINLIVLQFIARKRKDVNVRLLQDQGKLVGSTMAGLQIIESLKASGTEGQFFAQWSGYLTKFLNGMQRLGVTNQFLAVLPTTLEAFNTAIILGIGSYRVMLGYMSIGDLAAIQVLMANFIRPINQFVQLGSSLQEIDGNLKRLDDVLKNDTEIEVLESEAARKTARTHPDQALWTA